MRLLSFDIQQKALNGQIYVKDCNGVIFKNTGDVDATINGIPLPAGATNDDFKCGYPGDILQNAFQLNFQTPTIGINPQVIVIRQIANVIPKEEECKYIK